MGLDRTRWAEVLVGLRAVTLLEVTRHHDERVEVVIESADPDRRCRSCSVPGLVKERPRVALADLPVFGTPVRLVWVKRRWRCPNHACAVGTWTEDRPEIAPARAVMTTRAGLWATREVGAEVHTVAYAARQLAVAWNTVMAAVAFWGQALIEDPNRIAVTRAIGVDETKYLAANATARTRWITAICDLDARQVIDVIEGRQGPELSTWLDSQPGPWRDAVTVTVTDLHEPFRQSLATHLPNAVAVADPFHVVGVATRVVDRTRRRVQQDTLGHRGRRADPLYRSRKLLTIGAERLDAHHHARLADLLAAGDPNGEVHEAWTAKEVVRDLYTMWGDPPAAGRWLDGIIAGCRNATGPEVRGMARTLTQWRDAILAWHHTGHSNGPVEGLNSLIKKVKRVAAGFRNFTHYRLRILLACGGCNWHLLGTPPRSNA